MAVNPFRFAARTSWNLEPNPLARLAEERRRGGMPILDLTVSNPSRCGLTCPSEALLAALQDPRAITYDPQPRGMAEARQTISQYYSLAGVALPPDHILLTAGSSEAYGYLFRLLADPGDNILVPQPSYPLFEFLSRLNDIELAGYGLAYDDGWGIDFGWLEAAANHRSRALVVVNPNNPTGSLVKPEERLRVKAFCREHRLALIGDEVFLDFCLPEATSLAATLAGAEQVLTFVLNGLSKMVALPQMKLGWIAASGPPELVREAMGRLEVISDTYLSVGTPVQLALPKLLGFRSAMQEQIMRRVTANLKRLDGLLADQSLCTRLKVEGGWSVVLRLPRLRTDEEWALLLLEQEGVLLHPGHFFNFTQEGFLVASLIVEEAPFEEGLRRVLRAVESGAGRAAYPIVP